MSGQLTGVIVTQVDATPFYKPGQRHIDQVGNVFRYVKGGAAVAAALVYYLDDAWNSVGAITTTIAGSGLSFPLGVGLSTIGVGSYGWVQTAGVFAAITTNGAMVANSKAQTTAVAGKIDDASTVTISGLSPYATVAGAGNSQFYSPIEIYCAS